MKKKYILPLVFIFITTFGIVAVVYIVQHQQSLDIRDEAAVSVESAIIIDHTCTDLTQVPTSSIEQAKDNFNVMYGHTSHGSQIVSGMEVLMNDNDLYDHFDDHYYYRFGGTNPTAPDGDISLWDSVPGGDLGNPDRTTWEARTREVLLNSNSDYSVYPHLRNVVMWSWCSQVSSATEVDIDAYLLLMNQLEIDFPDVIFVYMTGHLDGTGEDGNLNVLNNQIRDHCETYNKVLFDFADIESYDPDGNYYLDRDADDQCNYDGGNWADEWCAANAGECTSYTCAHSHPLNCDQKAKAFWWMMARLAGWDPVQTGCTSDNDCSSPTPYCDTSNGDCVECLDATTHCATGESCENNSCECSGCYDNDTCYDGTSDDLCGIDGNACTICSENQSCQNGNCLTTSCSDDNDCSSPTPYCDTSNGDCVECLDATTHCATGESCENNSCECSGCYDNDTCYDGTSDDLCGIDGNACTICSENQSCQNGNCLTTSCSDDEDCDPGCDGYKRISYFCDNENCIFGESLICDEGCNAGCEIDDDCGENETCNTETCSCEDEYSSSSSCLVADIWGENSESDNAVNMWDLSKILGNWKQDDQTVDIWGEEGQLDGQITMWDVSKILGCWKK